MKPFTRSWNHRLCEFIVRPGALLFLLTTTSLAQEVAAVLSSDLRPYQEAYESFKGAFGRPILILPMSDDIQIPKETKVIVTFGGKAAVQNYPNEATLIYCIAPGLRVNSDSHDGKSIKIHMEPEPVILLSDLIEIQPGIKNLAILWISDNLEPFIRMLEKTGTSMSINIVSEHLKSAKDLPSVLRSLKGHVDALWLPADPLLINSQNFDAISQYSLNNGLPFYAPTEGLVEHGAVAGVSVSYKEIGRAAAISTQKALAGEDTNKDSYVQTAEISANLTSAKQISLTIPPQVIKKAAKVYP